MINGGCTLLEVSTLIVVTIISYSVGYWSYIWLSDDPSKFLAQFIGTGSLIVGFLLFIGIVKVVNR